MRTGKPPAFETALAEAITRVPKERIVALAREIAANAPLAVQAAKKAINGGWNQTLPAGLAIENSRAAEVLLSEDARGIRSAGVQKKDFSFKGR